MTKLFLSIAFLIHFTVIHGQSNVKHMGESAINRSQSVNDCNTWTFQMRYGKANSAQHP